MKSERVVSDGKDFADSVIISDRLTHIRSKVYALNDIAYELRSTEMLDGADLSDVLIELAFLERKIDSLNLLLRAFA